MHAIMMRLEMVMRYLVMIRTIFMRAVPVSEVTGYGVVRYFAMIKMMLIESFFILGIFLGVTYPPMPAS